MSQIDRGGLSYGIDVRDGFSSNLRNFRTEVSKSRAAWREFRRDFKNTATQTGKIRKDLEATTRALDNRQKALSRIKREERRFAKEQGKLAAAVRDNTQAMRQQDALSVRRIRNLNTETRSVRRLKTAYRQLNQARRSAPRGEITRGVGRPAPSRPSRGLLTSTAARGRARDFDNLATAVDRSGQSANRVSFTFRRLFGILAAFAAARAAVRGFNSLVSSAIRLNSELEQSVLGVGALLTALGTVVGPYGQIADDAERLAVAQSEGRRQLEFLRVDALKTAASFKELADTFQVALAPGFQAGLDLDEIRRLTVRISQAATAIGLPQNQLPEEIRSLLQGTITPRTTRIATSLGITNEDIRNAREAGELAEFLDKRFSSFAQAGEEALDTFTAITSNLRDGLGQILRLGGFDFFVELKSLLTDILDTIAVINEEGNLVFNEEAVAVVEEISSGLRDAVAEARAVGDGLDLGDAQSIARLIGRTIAGIARVARPLVSSVLQLLSALSSIANFLGQFPAVNQIILQSVTNLIKIIALMKIWALLTVRVKSLYLIVGAQLRGIRLLIKGAVTLTLTWRRAAIGLQAAFGIIAVALALIATSYSDVEGEAVRVTEHAEDLVGLLEGIPNLISNANRELEGQSELFQKLREDAEAAANALSLTSATAGLSGAVRTQQEAIIRLRQETADLEEKIGQEQLDIDRERQRLLEKQVQDQVRGVSAISNETEVTRDRYASLVDQQQQAAALTREIAENEVKANRLSAERFASSRARAEELRKQNVALQEQLQLISGELDIESIVRGRTGPDTQSATSPVVGGIDLAGSDPRLQILEEVANRILQTKEFQDRIEARLARVELRNRGLFGVSGGEFGEVLPFDAFSDIRADAIRRASSETNQILRDTLGVVNDTLVTEQELAALNVRQRNVDATRNQLASRRRAVEALRLADAAIGFNAEERFSAGTERLRLERTQRLRLEAQALGNLQRANAQTNVENARLELRLLEDKLRRERQILETQIAQAEARLSLVRPGAQLTDSQRAAIANIPEDVLAAEYRALQKQLDGDQGFGGQRQQLQTLIAQQAILLAEARDGVAQYEQDLLNTEDTWQSVINGFTQGLEDANAKARNSFQTTAEVVASTVESASKLISDSIVDAFDPSKDLNLKQRIGNFIQGIARQLLQLTIRTAIIRSLAGFGLGASDGGLVPGLANGGLVEAFSRARGLASGGTVGRSPRRPSGLPASDTVPAWLTPGEQVIKRPSVQMYGADAMRAINEGLIDPGSLRSLAGLTKRRRTSRKRSSKLGYAEGGLVGSSTRAAVSAPSPASEEQPAMPLVALPANDATIEALFAGGKGAVFEFLQANQSKVKASLGLPRS